MSSGRGERNGSGSQSSNNHRKPPGVITRAEAIRQPSSQPQLPPGTTQIIAEPTAFTQRFRNKTPPWFKSSPSPAPTPSTDPQKKSNPWVSSATRKLRLTKAASKGSRSQSDTMSSRAQSPAPGSAPLKSFVRFTPFIDLTTFDKF
jgi:hypothetical protein